MTPCTGNGTYFDKWRNLHMSDSELRSVIDKLHKLRTLRLARDRVRRVERELYGEALTAEIAPTVPGFLSQQDPLLAV